MQYGVIFDLDDTLIISSPVYHDLILQVMLMISKSIYPDFLPINELFAIFMEVDKRIRESAVRNHSEWFFPALDENSLNTGSSFPRELAEFYCESCLRAGVVPNKNLVEKAFNLGRRVFDADKYKLAPGAKAVAYYLSRSSKVTGFIITSGDESLQKPKIWCRKPGEQVFFDVFEKIMICPLDTSKGVYIKELMEEYDSIDEWIMVGDSVRSDINPALASGITACHLTRFSSHIATGDVLAAGDALKRYIQASDLNSFLKYFTERVKDEVQV